MSFQLSSAVRDRIRETTLVQDVNQTKKLAKLVEDVVEPYYQHSVALNSIAWQVAHALGKVSEGEQVVSNPFQDVVDLVMERDRYRKQLHEQEQRGWAQYHKEFCRLGLLCNHKPPTGNTEKEEGNR